MTVRADPGALPDLAAVAGYLRSTHALGIWRYDVETGLGEWSDEMFQLLDLPLSSPPPDLADLAETLDARDRAAIEETLRATLERGRDFEISRRLPSSDGQQRYLQASGTLVEIDGRRQLIGSLRDITKEREAYETVAAQAKELRALKEELHAENAQFRELFDQAPIFVAYGSTPGLRFKYANRAYCELVGNRDLVGKTVPEALPEVVAQGLVKVLTEVYQTGTPHIALEEKTYLRADPNGVPRLRYLTYIYEPIHNADRQVIGVLCLGYDVTEQCLAQQEAEALRDELLRTAHLAAMGTMAATLAHELNQPLTSVVMFASGLSKRLANAPDAKTMEALEAIEAEALRASEIMRRMRAVGAGHQIRQVPLDLAQVLTEAARLTVRACDDANIEFDLRHTGLASGDSLQVQQVVTNIVRNACEAMADCETQNILIATEDRTDEVLISIKDFGPGVPPQLLSKMFEGTQSLKEGGMGIGLAICRTIVEAHGGRIGVRNNRSGGATFWFTLRRHRE